MFYQILPFGYDEIALKCFVEYALTMGVYVGYVYLSQCVSADLLFISESGCPMNMIFK